MRDCCSRVTTIRQRNQEPKMGRTIDGQIWRKRTCEPVGYEDMGDFDYLDDVDVEKEDMDALEDGELSPDSMGEDIGEISEEAGEIAEEGGEIIAALL